MGREQGGKRSAGKRAGARPPRRNRAKLLVLALFVTAAVVAWGYLVYAAIDFGTTARGGDASAWWLLALAAAGAVACLFLALILVSRISRELGLTRAPERAVVPVAATEAPRSIGGRRASR